MTHEAVIPAPKVIRGEIPKRNRGGMPRGPFPWERHREIAVAVPPVRAADGNLRGGWVLCGEAKRRGDGPKTRREQIHRMRRRLEQHLKRRFPLERYQLAVVPAEGTDCDMELYMRFLGELSPEEDAADRARKRENYQHMLDRRRELAAERALQNRPRGGSGR